MFKQTLILIIAIILLISCDYQPLTEDFLEQFFASKREPIVEVEFREEKYIKEAGELPEIYTFPNAPPPLIGWPDPPRKTDSLIRNYYIVMLNYDTNEPIWIAKAKKEDRTSAFSTPIMKYTPVGPGSYLIAVIPVSKDFDVSLLDNFTSFMNDVTELYVDSKETEVADVVRRAGILGMGLAATSVYNPLTIDNVEDETKFNVDEFIREYKEENTTEIKRKMLLQWSGNRPASKYYILVKDEYGKINWLASVKGSGKSTDEIEKDYVSLNMRKSPIVGKTKHTISLYAVPDTFPQIENPIIIQRLLENDTNDVLDRTSKTIYTSFEVWSSAIINGILDSDYVKESPAEILDPPVVNWEWTEETNDIKEYYVWITKEGYTAGNSNAASFYWASRDNQPVYLGKFNKDGSKSKDILFDYNAPERSNEDIKYYLSVFVPKTPNFYLTQSDFLLGVDDPAAVNIYDLPSEIIAWSTTEFKVTPTAPFTISTPRGILSPNHIGPDKNPPAVSWKDQPTDTDHYYLIMKNRSTNKMNWLVKVNGSDTNSVTGTLIYYIPPTLEVQDQEYELTVYACSSNFEGSIDKDMLYKKLEAGENVLDKANSIVTVEGVEAIAITSPDSVGLDESNFGEGGVHPDVSWIDRAGLASDYYIVMKNKVSKEMNWFVKLSNNGTSTTDTGMEFHTNNIDTTIQGYSAEGSLLGEVYTISIYGVSDRFTESDDSIGLKNSLEKGVSGVLYSGSTDIRAQYIMTLTSDDIKDGLLSRDRVDSRTPPVVNWSWNANADTSGIVKYFITILDENFNPSALIPNPTWMAYINNGNVSSSAGAVTEVIAGIGNYRAPSSGDDMEYSFSVLAMGNTNVNLQNLKGVDTASVVSGTRLPLRMINAGVLSVSTIKFRIPTQ